MCTNCIGTADFLAANAALLAGAAQVAIRAGEPEPVRDARTVVRDARTVAFLRGLALDPVEVLGAEVVGVADDPAARARAHAVLAARAQTGSGLRGAFGAMRSQRRIALQ